MSGYRLIKEHIPANEFAARAGISTETLNELLKKDLKHLHHCYNGFVFIDTAALTYFQNNIEGQK